MLFVLTQKTAPANPYKCSLAFRMTLKQPFTCIVQPFKDFTKNIERLKFLFVLQVKTLRIKEKNQHGFAHSRLFERGELEVCNSLL